MAIPSQQRNQKKRRSRKNVQRKTSRQQVPRGNRKQRRAGKNRRTGGMIGIASPARNMMRPMAQRSTSDGHMCRFRGTDFLTAVTIGGTTAAAGDVLYTAVVNPKTLGVSRLATVSALWERYKFRSLKFRYAPVANATQTGQIIGYVDYDTYDDPTGISGMQNLQRAAAHYGEKPVQVWQGQEKPVFWEIKDVDPLTDLYVDSDGTDPRWTNQGRFVLLAASAITSGVACGNIYLDYDVEFYIPQLELTPSTGFGDRFDGGGSLSASAILGTVPVAKSWNNLPISIASNVLTLPAGSYTFGSDIVGTTITAFGFTTTGTIIDGTGTIATDAKTAIQVGQVTGSSQFTLTLTATAATVSVSNIVIALLPSNALTLSQKKLNQVSRLLSLAGSVKTLQAQFDTLSKQLEGKEVKECKSFTSASTSSVSSTSCPSRTSGDPSIPFATNEGYYVVPKRGSQTPFS